MSRDSYNHVRETVNGNRGVSVLPSYYKVQAAKTRCYPPVSATCITETSAVVSLQPLLDHTTSRLLTAETDTIKSYHESITENITFFFKWGYDGSSSEQYKQKFSENDSSDANVLFTSIVPLKMISFCNESNKEILI
jgi:hypothetical protein